MLGHLTVNEMGFHRIVKVEATEPEQQTTTGSWVAQLEIHQAIPDYFAKRESHHETPLVTVHKLTLYFKNEPDWQAGVIYEVPTDE